MNPHYTYLLVNAGCILVPLLFSFHPKLNFYKEWRFFIPPCLITAVFFLLWDALFTHLGVWSFNPAYVTGLFLAGLPAEEYLFFICIPFACVFSYQAFNVLFRFNRFHQAIRIFYALLSLLLLITGLLHINQLYTSTTFILLTAALAFFVYRNVSFLPAYFFCFLFILGPFLISNGILTGSFFNRVVVMYNDRENLGIRILTIPVEDVFYANLLLLLNIYGFEYLKSRHRKLLPVP